MANEFIVKNGLLVESKDPGITPISTFSSSIQLPGITVAGSSFPQHYLTIDANSGQIGYFTGSAVSFLIESPVRYSLTTATGTVYVNAGVGNGMGSGDDDNPGIVLNSPQNQTTPGAGFRQTYPKPAGLPNNYIQVQYFFPTEVQMSPGDTNVSIFTNIDDTFYDGLLCDYIISETSGTTLRQTGTIRASWDRSSGISFVNVAAPTIGNVGTELSFNFNKTAGNVQMRATATTGLSSAVAIGCSIKLFAFDN